MNSRACIGFMCIVGACSRPSASSDGSTDTDATGDDSSDSSSESESDAGEPQPECAWEPAAADPCSPSAAPLDSAPEGIEDDYFTPSIAVGPEGAVHVLVSKEHRVGNSFPIVLSYFSNASGEWVEQELDLDPSISAAEIHVSAANVIRAASAVYLRNDSGMFVRPAPFGHDILEVTSDLAAARELDLAYLIVDKFEAELDGPSYSVWSDEGDCVRRLWTMSECQSFTYPYNMRIAVAPDGGAPIVVAELDDRLALTDFSEPTPQLVPVGSSPVGLLGDVEMDATGRIHACFWRNDADEIVWASGLGADNWQEQSVSAALGGGYCQLAVNSESDVWLTDLSAGLSIWHKVDSFEAEDLSAFLPSGLDGDLLDVTLGVDGQPVVVGSRVSPDESEAIWFVASRVGDAEWTSEVIAVEALDPSP